MIASIRSLLTPSLVLGMWLTVQTAVAAQPCESNELNKAYQTILYAYFQQDYYQALTQFEVLEQACPNQLEQISNPGVAPLLLKGGISLAYGLHDRAETIFNQLLASAEDRKIRAQAWLLLAKTLFENQQSAQSAQALAQISYADADDYFSQADKDEWIYLRFQLANQDDTKNSTSMANDDWQEALSSGSIYRHYILYNQGLAQLNRGQFELAVATLKQVGKDQPTLVDDWLGGWLSPLQLADQQELDALADRASLTLGYAYLKKQNAAQAIKAFNQVRLDSFDTDSALLGYGWAAAQNLDYQVALSVWQKLQNAPRSNEYVLESYLASAYAYEQAFAPTQAIEKLQNGLRRYQQEEQLISEQLANIQDDFFIDLAGNSDWSESIPEFLTDIMLSKHFRIQLNQLTESLAISAQLGGWQAQLDTFNLMLDERQAVAIERAQKLKNDQTLGRLDALKKQRLSIVNQLEQAKGNPALLNDEPSIGWQQRLDKAQQRLQQIQQKQQLLNQKAIKPSYAKRLKRLQGILLWQANEAYASRAWQAKKQLKEIDTLIAKATEQQVTLVNHLNQPPKFQAQRQRIVALQQQLNTKMARVQNLQATQLAQLKQAFKQRLKQQIAQLQNYQLQGQLAIVRLNDKAFRKAQADQQQGGVQ